MSYLEDSRENGDPVRPGEQWFFYWKTSAALWESRILQFHSNEIIFIPLNWGFHAQSATEWDFGTLQSERDFLRLSQLMTQHGRRFCWIMPLSPAPFLINGGVPAFAAKTLSLSTEGIHLAAMDNEQNLNKMFSFFEPKVFAAYSQFLHNFEAFITEHQIQAPVWGIDFFYWEDQRKVSFMWDGSTSFEHGFSRFFRNKYPNGSENKQNEKELKLQFRSEVADLFRETASTVLSSYWMGQRSLTVLGAGPKDCIQRSLPAGKSQLDFTREILRHFIHDEMISSALLRRDEKKDLINFILSEHFGPRDADEKYEFQPIRPELTEEYRPYGVVELFTRADSFKKTGLFQYLHEHLRSLYLINENFTLTPEWVMGSQHKIKIFQGSLLDRTQFAQLLKLFMLGQKILLDISGLNSELDKKLQVFIIENNIKTQAVNYVTATTIYELGDGRLIIFDGTKLVGKPDQKNFWHHIFKFFNLKEPEVLMEEDLFSSWRIRSATSHELNYLDVRRINFYNPTSYKKYVTINTRNRFAFLKVVDPLRAQARSNPQGIEVEILPNGKISLDFGHYEEASCH